MSEERSSEKAHISPEDTFKILLATDIHLDYEASTSREQEDDSFRTFEEILGYAKEYDVDFILLGGDLFHDSKPSQIAVMKCMDLLRKYCLGTGSNKIQFLSDPEMIFDHCSNKTVNFEDPNLNVAIPVFSIHGNHDDPSFGAVGSLDLLAVSGLVNYFGKWTDLSQVTIPPLLFKKGASHLALYGLSYIKDQRLSRLFRDRKVDMLRPKEIDDCFNMFVLHQNRTKHSELAYIMEDKLPDFLDFILWGHEHECRIRPEKIKDTNYYICQPGSPVATSLCEGEAVPKHVGILLVNQTSYKLKKIKLKTVRPFVFDSLSLREAEIKYSVGKSASESVSRYVDEYIEEVLIPKAAEQLTGHKRQPHKPLLRLRVFYSDEDQKFDTMRLSHKYGNEIANPMDMILFRKEKADGSDAKGKRNEDESADLEAALGYFDDVPEWNRTVQAGIRKFFEVEQNEKAMTVLSVAGMNEALVQFIDRNDGSAFKDTINHQIKKTVEHICGLNLKKVEDILPEIMNYKEERSAKQAQEEEEIRSMLSDNSRTIRKVNVDSDAEPIDNDDADGSPATTKGRGRGGRGSQGGGRGRGRGKNKPPGSSKDELDISTVFVAPKSPRTWKKPATKAVPQSKPATPQTCQIRAVNLTSDSDSD